MKLLHIQKVAPNTTRIRDLVIAMLGGVGGDSEERLSKRLWDSELDCPVGRTGDPAALRHRYDHQGP